jgi:hypothetical protein
LRAASPAQENEMQHDPNEAKASFDDLYSHEDPRD